MKLLLRHYLLAVVCLLFFSSEAASEGSAPTFPRHTIEVGVGVTSLDYEEKIEDVDVDIDGLMYGIVGSYTYHNNIMLNASVEYQVGDLDYEGMLQTLVIDPSGTEIIDSPSESETEDLKVECRGLIGYDYVLGGSHVVTPFLGLGYRYLSDDIKGFGGYERRITYWYSPVGLKTCSPLSKDWTWGIGLEYDIFWDGEAGSDSDLLSDLDQDSGYGVKFSVRFNRHFKNDYSLFIEPHMAYWDIDESEAGSFGGQGGTQGIRIREPDNTTTSYGLRIGLAF